jgi:NAD+ synthase (glutamine-hydrolysing)
MGTVNSGQETRTRAKQLAQRLGATHNDTDIDEAVEAHGRYIEKTLGFKPRYLTEGGSASESLALQNIQARNRMVAAYELAQLHTSSVKDHPRRGAALLVLGSGNVDENLRGYYTKYDASSADIAPLGSISKNDAQAFQRWARDQWSLPILDEFLNATPSAELLPLSAGIQSDEEEMGFTYAELSELGILRKVEKCGPWSAYQRLLNDWRSRPGFTPRKIAQKVMDFFRFYVLNRHKTTVLSVLPPISPTQTAYQGTNLWSGHRAHIYVNTRPTTTGMPLLNRISVFLKYGFHLTCLK